MLLRHLTALCLPLVVATSALAQLAPAPAPFVALQPRLVVSGVVVSGATDQPISLGAVEVAVELTPNAAETRIQMRFDNPNARILEGELQFPLAAGQSMVGFALDIDGTLRDAVPVDKPKAQAIFEDIQRVRIDPGLLERTQGNNYKLRVYPIPPRGSRTVVIRIAEALAPRAGQIDYMLPVLGAQGVERYTLNVTANGFALAPALVGAPGLTFAAKNGGFTATSTDVTLANGGRLQARAANGPRLLTETRGAQTYFHADLQVGDAPQSRVNPQHIALVWDASGSAGGTSHARELALLDHYFRTLGTARVTLYFLRDTLSAASEHQLRGGDWTTLRRALEAAQYDGATRLQSLAQVSTADAMIVVTDGLSNYGAGEIATPSIPTHLVTAAVRSNPPLLARLAGRSGGRFIDLTRITPQAAATALTAIPERIAGVTADGASDFAYASYYVEAGRIVVAGVLSEPATMLRIELVDANGRRRTVTQRIDGAAPRSNIATALWGELRLAELEGEYDVNRMAIRRLGAKLGLATRETSLLVLERLEDYVRNEIEPPSSLRAAYQAQLTMQRRSVEQNRSAHIERVAKRYAERGKWWDQNYPKGERAIALAPAEPRVRSEGAHDRLAAGLADQPRQRNEAARPPASAAAPAPQPAPSVALDARRAATEAPAAGAAQQATAKVAGNMDARAARIQLKAWTPDAPYAKRLESATVTDRYRVYLDERAGYTASTAFFLDAADFFLAKDERALGLRILSNLAEMDLENRHILRILGYRLMQADEPALAAPVFARVLALAPNEPQSYRDLGLALARSGEPQRAIDALYEVVVRPWDSRFPEIDLVALAELNAIVATAGKPLDTSKIESRLLRNLPVDLRVVLSWDADNTDIDLWVTDPNGERAHYGHRNTYQGGRMSADFTGGYGPEEFILKNAKPGKYKVEANFYGHRQQVVAGATTLMLALQTGFGTERADERRVTLRLRGQSEVVFVGEFEIGAP